MTAGSNCMAPLYVKPIGLTHTSPNTGAPPPPPIVGKRKVQRNLFGGPEPGSAERLRLEEETRQIEMFEKRYNCKVNNLTPKFPNNTVPRQIKQLTENVKVTENENENEISEENPIFDILNQEKAETTPQCQRTKVIDQSPIGKAGTKRSCDLPISACYTICKDSIQAEDNKCLKRKKCRHSELSPASDA